MYFYLSVLIISNHSYYNIHISQMEHYFVLRLTIMFYNYISVNILLKILYCYHIHGLCDVLNDAEE